MEGIPIETTIPLKAHSSVGSIHETFKMNLENSSKKLSLKDSHSLTLS